MPDVKDYGEPVQQVVCDPLEDSRPDRDQVVGKTMVWPVQFRIAFP